MRVQMTITGGCRLLLLICVFSLQTACSLQEEPTVLDYVDPFIGTGGHGHTFPGAVAPFGMIQLSPDCGIKGWDWASGYHYSDSSVMGFSHTHLSGSGWSDLGDILLMPTVGELQMEPGPKSDPDKGYRSRFSHENEKASPGYYQVFLDDYKVNVELTVSERVGVHRYTFPKGAESNIIIDPVHKIFGKTIETSIALEGNQVKGYCFSRGWGGKRYTYFVISFSRPFNDFGIYDGPEQLDEVSRATGENVKAYVQFQTGRDEEIEVQVAISQVSQEGAEKNLQTGKAARSFDKVLEGTRKLWVDELSKIEVNGGTREEKTIFYTGLYHNFLHPSLSTDVDGNYVAAGKSLKASGFVNYTTFSLWDTFRATHPLLTILQPAKSTDFINSLISRHRDADDHLPMWELCGHDNVCMTGSHSTSVIWDAISKGIPGINKQEAFDAMWDITQFAKANEVDKVDGNVEFFEKGYILHDNSKRPRSVARTLELSYNHWCVQQLARQLGEDQKADTLQFKTDGFRYLWNENEKKFWPRLQDGSWIEGIELDDWATLHPHYVAGNIWAFKFGAFHKIDLMIDLMGGVDSFESALDELFTREIKMKGEQHVDISGFVGVYGHGDEPGHHIPYLYNYTRSPWKTQRVVSRIRKDFYHASPDGYVNNEDCGQMSAWYVFSALGFYPVCPGKATYDIGAPLFENATIHLENGKHFKVVAHQSSPENMYVQSVRLNGKLLNRWQIKHEEIISGGILEFDMGKQVPVP